MGLIRSGYTKLIPEEDAELEAYMWPIIREVMSENYIKNHFDDIKKYASAVENRIDDDWCTMESVLEDNMQFLELAKKHNANIVLVDDQYEINIDL